ncbi:hypothetical protein [Cellulomonas phragmiteti]|uniref:PA14 domain-containing protein n=1 Tax=Cellulomonas phragmiteti TaxID=478780 RepID=A0ABQ4DH05_9CELL|nr:hypothetical protein [Cellulomonas phragmiteti]GIG38625.1 hypothetical protein Cph01nite_03870 [Cellulomonas phragmiteti]
MSVPDPRRLVHRLVAVVAGALVTVPLAAPAAVATTSDPVELPLLTSGTTWTYLDDATEPHGTAADVLAWTAPGFDDAGWARGTGPFGAKNGALGDLGGGYRPATLLRHYVNGVSGTTVPTYFFRTTVDLDADTLDRLVSLQGQVAYDDAVRVYLDGVLVFRDRDERASDPTRNLQYAGVSAGNPVSSRFTVDPAALPAGTLVPGTHTIAVALYQDRASSSDVYLDLPSLTATLAPATAPDEQRLEVTVPAVDAGQLVWAVDGSNDLVDLGVAQREGDRFAARGVLNPVRVTDTRRGAPAWSLSGQVSDFVSGDRTVDGKHLGWTPSVADDAAGAVAGAAVVSGFVAGDGLSTPAVLGAAPAGHAPGSALLGADLELLLPVSVTQGRYAATLTLTALS